MTKYDLIIVGSGPAGMSAAMYAARFKLNALLIGEKMGGYATDAYKIENYPGVPEKLSGLDLMLRFKKQLDQFDVPLKTAIVKEIKKTKSGFAIETDKDKFESKALILALGTERKKLKIPGEEEFLGKGVAYCATCDAFFFKDKTVAVAGGANSAFTSALQLAEVAKQVYIIYRGENPTAFPDWVTQVKKNKKITAINNTNIVEIKGDKKVSEIVLDKPFGGKKNLAVDGIFVEIGAAPVGYLIKNLNLKTDDKGYIQVDGSQSTNVKGIFAAGDTTTGSNKFQQIITAASEGAVATSSAYRYLQGNK